MSRGMMMAFVHMIKSLNVITMIELVMCVVCGGWESNLRMTSSTSTASSSPAAASGQGRSSTSSSSGALT